MNLIDKHYTWYNSTFDINNKILLLFKYDKIKRLILVVSLNVLASFYYKYIKKEKKKYDLLDDKYLVSLTSFPLRIKRLWIVIESLFDQTLRPSEIHLWLSNEQFGSREDLPKNLLNLERKGLIIHLCKGDLKSHKKYYYALKKFPERAIITFDDDIFYPSDLVELLYQSHLLNPECISANRCILIDSTVSYKSWKSPKPTMSISQNLLPTGCGGVLYPPSSLDQEVLNKDAIMKTSLFGDDLWLNALAHLNGSKTCYTGFDKKFIPLIYKKNINLYTLNTGNNGRNDKQIKAIREYFIRTRDKDPFVRL